MSPTVFEEEVSLARQSKSPSFLCNIFGHKWMDEIEIDEVNTTYECKRCGEIEHLRTYKLFSITITNPTII